jgi:DNA polymerase
MWDQFHRASWNTLEEAGSSFFVGAPVWPRVGFQRQGGFLWLTLPSGRRLAYPTPAKENREVPWSDKRLPVAEREHKDMLTVLAFEQGHAHRPSFYPGILFQHSVQAIARDLLAHGMNNVEAAGYPVVMSIHDEVICEIPTGASMPERTLLSYFTELLCQKPTWAEGIPLLAEGWIGHRYRK